MLKKKRIVTRDWSMVRIIQGATKSGIHKDRKKDACRRACRVPRDCQEEVEEAAETEEWDRGTSEEE